MMQKLFSLVSSLVAAKYYFTPLYTRLTVCVHVTVDLNRHGSQGGHHSVEA